MFGDLSFILRRTYIRGVAVGAFDLWKPGAKNAQGVFKCDRILRVIQEKNTSTATHGLGPILSQPGQIL